MPEPTDVQSLLGVTLHVSAGLPPTYDAAGYADTDIVWTACGEVENYGQHGVVSAVTEFTPAGTGVVAKVKGSKNYGNKSLVLGSVPADTGQVLLAAASESRNHYSAKETYPSGRIVYFDVLVSKFEKVDGAVNDVGKVNCDLAICRKPVEVAAV